MEYQGGSIFVEPWGGSGGICEWSYNLKGPIQEILIAHGEVINSIMFQTVDIEHGTTIDSPKFGGNGGSQTKVIIAGSSSEYLTGIRGTLGHYDGHLVVKSLRFITNEKIYGPFGTESGGTPFSLMLKAGGAIVGFHGRAGSYLDAIGVYLQKFIKIDKTDVLSRRPRGIRARIEKIINIDGEKEIFVAIEGYYRPMGFNVIIFKMGKN